MRRNVSVTAWHIAPHLLDLFAEVWCVSSHHLPAGASSQANNPAPEREPRLRLR